MNELQAALKIILSDSYVMYFKAHSYHWNVEGMLFPMLHEFFGDIYEEIYGSIDTTAEHIRIIDAYAPISLVDVIGGGMIQEDPVRPSNVRMMLSNLATANIQLIESLNKAFDIANQQNNQGLMDYLAARLDAHAKHGWMIRSTLKNIGE